MPMIASARPPGHADHLLVGVVARRLGQTSDELVDVAADRARACSSKPRPMPVARTTMPRTIARYWTIS